MQVQPIKGFRLSPQQKRLWSLQRGGARPVFNAYCLIRLEGGVDEGLLKAALEEVVSRHEILRTRFRNIAGVPLQVVEEESKVVVESSDLRGPEGEGEGRLKEFIDDLRRRPPRDKNGPTLNAFLMRRSATLHLLLLSLPALCADHATLDNLAREVSLSYLSAFQPVPPPGEVFQYADFAEWRNELLEAEDMRAGRDYWRQGVSADALSARLPFERARDSRGEFEPEFVSRRVEGKLRTAVASLAGEWGVSPPSLLLSCWSVLLWKYCGAREFIVGVGGAGRTAAELKTAMGLFAAYFPLTFRLVEELPVRELSLRVAAEVTEAERWQDFFTWESVGDRRPDDADIFFPFCFEYHAGAAKHGAGRVTISTEEQYACLDQYGIKLVCLVEGDRPRVQIHYDAARFDGSDVSQLAEQYITLLSELVNSHGQTVGDIQLLTDGERRRLVSEVDRGGGEARGLGIHELFERQAERTPESPAVRFEESELSYRDLNRRANQLAHYLRTLGVGPEARVALCVERSAEMLTGLLGILKAGGAYVPLEPSLPRERLGQLLREARVTALVTQQSLADLFPARDLPRVVRLDADGDILARQSGENPAVGLAAENLVYLIFTSGSTGRPKGVAVEHRQLVNYVQGILPRLGLKAGASFAVVTSVAADLGNTVIFAALCSGGLLHVVSQARATQPDELADYFTRRAVDCLKIVPSHLAALLGASARPRAVLPRELLILGGERCSRELVAKVRAHAPDIRILNHYGPTETTVGVLACRADESFVHDAMRTVSLGRPLAHAQVLLLDSRLRPLPAWMPGELYIGGDCLARGYLGRPDLTAEKFTPNPWSGQAGGRLYRTGDRARRLPDGGMEFLGRIDNQVKVRGHRVEPGEIEAALGRHPAVRACAVVAREGAPNDVRLLAYAETDGGVAGEDLGEYLRLKLPDYMLPNAFIILDALPLTTNGKIDRRALPPPEDVRAATAKAQVRPCDSVELRLWQIWAEILQDDSVGVTDSFFDAGGNSLLAVSLTGQIQQQFGRRLPLTTLLGRPSIRRLAELLREGDEPADPSPLVAIQPAGARLPFFFVHGGGGNVLGYLPLGRSLGTERPFYGLQSAGLNAGRESFDSVEGMASCYVEALRGVQPVGPYLLGGWCMGAAVAFEMTRQLQGQSQSVALLALVDGAAPRAAPAQSGLHTPAGEQIRPGSQSQLQAALGEHTTIAMRFARHHSLPVSADELGRLAPDAQLDYLLEKAREGNLLPPGAEPLQVRRLLEVYWGNIKAVNSYRPRVTPCRATLFRASDPPAAEGRDALMGWDEIAAEGVELHMIPGDHNSILLPPHVKVLAQRLADCIARATG